MLDRWLTLGSLPLLVMALLAAGVGIPIPEDPVLLAAGVIAHRTPLPVWMVLPMVYGAALVADCVLFLWARRFGDSLLQRRPFSALVTPKRRRQVSTVFAKHGAKAVFVGRHLMGLRPAFFVVAGIERMPLRTFALWDGLAALITIPLVFALGYLFSAHVALVEAKLARAEHWLAAGVGVALLVGWLAWSILQQDPSHHDRHP